MATSAAFRDLSAEFFRLKAQTKARKLRFAKPSLCITSPTSRGQQRLLSFQGDDLEAPVHIPSLPPLWIDALEEAHDDIAHIKEKMGQLQKAQQRRLLEVFAEAGREEQRDEVEDLSVALTGLFKSCESRIRKIAACEGGTAGDRRLQENAQKALAAQLHGLSLAFRQQQKIYIQQVRRRDGGEELLSDSTSAPSQPQTQSLYSEVSDDVYAEFDVLEGDVDMRCEEVAQIARSLAELNQIFKDVSTLVIEQGTMLDRVDYNMEQAASRCQAATKQLTKAEHSRRSGRAARCITWLVVTIFVLVILLVLKHR